MGKPRSNAAALRELVGERKLTFLVGAGCSTDPPSGLPTGREMMRALLEYVCPEGEAGKLLGLPGLRFEAVVETLRDTVDPDLHLIDLFGKSDRPNRHHLFLAEMARRGHSVITTNFDFLIEHALLQQGVKLDNVHVVITPADFARFTDTEMVRAPGECLLVKIHGSTRNIITGEDTRNSLIATLRAFGTQKQGLNVFQCEPFKQPLLARLFEGQTLIVVGYSGSDDFDIVPTLTTLRTLAGVFWINHTPDRLTMERICEITEGIQYPQTHEIKLNFILQKMKLAHPRAPVYRIDASTRAVIQALAAIPAPRRRYVKVNAAKWLRDHIPPPSAISRHQIASRLYRELQSYVDALTQSQKVLNLAEKCGDLEATAASLNNIGNLQDSLGDPGEALRAYTASVECCDRIGLESLAGLVRSNIGSLYYNQGRRSDALQEFQRALSVWESQPDSIHKGILLGNLGASLFEQEPETAIGHLRKGVRILDECGALREKALALVSLGDALARSAQDEEAERHFQIARRIQRELSQPESEADIILKLARFLENRGQAERALQLLHEGFDLIRHLPWSRQQLAYQSCIVRASTALGHHEDALAFAVSVGDSLLVDEKYGAAIDLYSHLAVALQKNGDTPEAAHAHYVMAMATQLSGNPVGAIDYFKAMLPILERTGPAEIPNIFGQIGGCFLALQDYAQALQWFQHGIDSSGKSGSTSEIAVLMMNAGLAALKLSRFDEAVTFLDGALRNFLPADDALPAYVQSTRDHLSFAREMRHLAAAEGDTAGPVSALQLRPHQSGAGELSAARQLLREGDAQRANGRMRDAEKCYNDSAELFFAMGAVADLAIARRKLAEVRFATGRYDESAKLFEAALFESKTRDSGGEQTLQLTVALASALEYAQNIPEALKFYQQALAIGRRMDADRAPHAVVHVTCKLADLMTAHAPPAVAARGCDAAVKCLGGLGRYDEAAQYASRMLDLCRRLEDAVGTGRAFGHLGAVQSLKGSHAEALASWEEAAACFRKAGERPDLEVAEQAIRRIRADTP